MAKSRKRTKPTNPADQISGLLGAKKPKRDEAAVDQKHFSPDEHIAWVEDHCRRLDKRSGRWVPIRYTDWQADGIRKLFQLDDDGVLRYRTIMPCFVRRTAKSEISAAYDLHRAEKYDDQVIVIQANSADQAEDTVFKAIGDMLTNSPKLKARVDAGEITILSDAILFDNGSIIKLQPASEASTYGQRIHVYHNTELCKARDDSVYQVGASSTGDAWCGVAIVDSNVGDATNAVWRYVQLAQEAEAEADAAAREGRPIDPDIGDASIGCVYLHFADLADVLKRGCGVGLEEGIEPIHPWLDAEWIRGRYKQMTRSEFLRNHCNQPSGAGEVLWTDEQIDPLVREELPHTASGTLLDKLTELVGGNGVWSIGVGLDRAGAFSKTPDRSVLSVVGMTTVTKWQGIEIPVFDERGEKIAAELCDGSLFVVLGAWEFMRALRDPIQSKLLEIDRQWGIGGLALEQYQASDLGEWCEKQRFKPGTTIEHMSSQAKQQLVTFMHGLVITRRFLIPGSYPVLRAELKNYREDASGGGIPSYGGKRRTVELDMPVSALLLDAGRGSPTRRQKTWIKDDYLEATLWAIKAARSAPSGGPRARVLNKPAGL